MVEASEAEVLLIEDQDDMAALTGVYLKRAGYSVQRAENGLKGLEALKERKTLPRIILLDVLMPVMDGYEFMDRLQGYDEYTHVPIIMLTSLNTAKDVMQAVRKGAVRYCTKPIDATNLIAQMKMLLGES